MRPMLRSSSWLNDTPLERTAVNNFTGMLIIPKLMVPLQIDRAITMTVPGRFGRQVWSSGLHQGGRSPVTHRHRKRCAGHEPCALGRRRGRCVRRHQPIVTGQSLQFPSRRPPGAATPAPPRQRFDNG